MAKKKWKKPELIVLVRGKPEEAILAACKLRDPGSTGAANQYSRCAELDAQSKCIACKVVNGS